MTILEKVFKYTFNLKSLSDYSKRIKVLVAPLSYRVNNNPHNIQ